MNRHSRSLWAAAIAVLTALASGSAQAQAPATVNGRVVDAQSNTPIIGAQVRVVNTNLGAVTGDDGRYVIRSVTPGAIDIRVARIGFAEQRRTVNPVPRRSPTSHSRVSPSSWRRSSAPPRESSGASRSRMR